MSNKRDLETITNHVYGTWRAEKDWKVPKIKYIDRAEGVYLYDEKGNEYIDFSSQFICNNLGHGNSSIIDSIKEQSRKLCFVAPAFADQTKAKAAKALLEVTPEGLNHFFFSTSGTEANEAAVKIARMFQEKGKYKIISRYHSYHGATAASITLTGDPRRWWAERINNTVGGIRHAPDPYCYRCPFGLKYPECGIQCAKYLDYMIKEEGNVAAFIFESIVGTNGKIVPPDEYYPIVKKICDRHNVLTISDEIMVGLYRTGKPFGINHWNVTPDIITMAKAVTGAYTPVGVTATTKEIREHFEEKVFCHGHTYAGHPLALAAVPPTIKELKNLVGTDKPKKVSKHLKQRLYELGEKHESIGDIRGKGHFWGLELVKNRKTKEPFNVKSDKYRNTLMTDKVAEEAMKNGLYFHRWYDNLTIAPPLTITKEEVDEAIEILDDALEVADKKAEETGVPVSKSSEGIVN